MARYLIEIQHSDDHDGCVKALGALMDYGSHLVTHAEFGCEDGVHCGWLIVDVDNQDDAQQMVPPQYRADARVVRLRNWSLEQIKTMVKELKA